MPSNDSPSLPRLRRRLLAWFDRHRRDLPWRHDRDPYRIWVSEIMLQQTQAATVIPYFHRFLQAFPDVAALAAADEQVVLRHWEGLGYYRRARNLHHAARQLVAEHGGPGAVHQLLKGRDASDGFTTLWEHGRLEMSVEAAVLLPWYTDLFSEEERGTARRRLTKHRFEVDSFIASRSANPPLWTRANSAG